MTSKPLKSKEALTAQQQATPLVQYWHCEMAHLRYPAKTIKLSQ